MRQPGVDRGLALGMDFDLFVVVRGRLQGREGLGHSLFEGCVDRLAGGFQRRLVGSGESTEGLEGAGGVQTDPRVFVGEGLGDHPGAVGVVRVDRNEKVATPAADRCVLAVGDGFPAAAFEFRGGHDVGVCGNLQIFAADASADIKRQTGLASQSKPPWSTLV